MLRFLKVLVLIASLGSGSVTMAQPRQNDDERAAKLASKSFRLDGGLINSAEGEVRCLRRGVPIEDLGLTEEIENGDAIETREGRAEFLLNPGYYLRLDNHTQVVLADVSPTNLKVEIINGSVIFEIAVDTSPMWQETKDSLFSAITVVTARDEYTIVRPGAYRFTVAPDGKTIVSVEKGLLIADGVPVKASRIVSAFGGVVDVAKSKRERADAFDEWSRARAIALVKSNKSLKRTEWYKLMDRGSAYLDVSGGGSAERAAEMRTVSARTGEVTYSEIGTFLKRVNSDWQPLTNATTLSGGDRLRTDLHTRVEIHPYPYVYMFVGGNTELSYRETSDGQVSIMVAKGSVVVFVPDIQWKKQSPSALKITDGQSEYEIQRYGYYRLNVTSQSNSEMLVYYGSADAPDRTLKAPTKLVRRGSSVDEFGLDRKAGDNLDVWSDRRRALIQTSGGRRAPRGVWFLKNATGEYTFVPGTRFYKSPYGGDYSVVFQGDMPTRMRRQRDPFGGVR